MHEKAAIAGAGDALVLALDQGGSKCDGLLVRPDGQALRWVRWQNTGQSGRGRVATQRTVDAALEGLEWRALAVHTVARIGDDWLQHLARDGRSIRIDGVEEAAGPRALANQPHAIVAIAGTGARVHALGSDGRAVSLDALGPVLGDDGSGYQVGLMALRAAGRALSNPRHPSLLAAAVAEHVCRIEKRSAPAPDERLSLLVRFSLRPHDRSVFASFAPLVDAAAAAGDAVARGILAEAAGRLAANVADAAELLGPAAAGGAVIAAGSVAMRSDGFWSAFCAALAAIAPQLRPERLGRPVVVGVALAALAAGGGCGEAVRRRVLETADAMEKQGRVVS